MHFAICNLFLFPATASACNVPVFRYALERWPADPYEVIIFHRGPLGPADKAAVATLEKHAGTRANVDLHLVDLDGKPDEDMIELFRAQVKPELPWMVVRYPVVTRIETTVWAGRLDAAAVQALLDSPARREIVKGIGAGETAVWVLVECGDPKKDDAAARVLEGRLPKLKTLLKLPELTDAPADRVAPDGPPLRIAFSLVRVSGTDPGEQLLVRMLLHSEDDLAGKKDEPMAFPVFGRGRALYALVGKGITDENIDDAGAFLVGPCSCEVKRKNPGTDLLMAADWDALLEGKRVVKDPEPPPLRGLPDHLEEPPEEELSVRPRPVHEMIAELILGGARFLVEESPPETPTQEEQPGPTATAGGLTLARNIGVAVLVALAILAAYALVLRGRNRM